MIKLRSLSAKGLAILICYLPIRFAIYFLASRLHLPHTNLIELLSEIFVGLLGLFLIFINPAATWEKLRDWRHWPVLIKMMAIVVAWSLVSLSFTPAGAGQALRGLRLDLLGFGLFMIIWLFPPAENEAADLVELAYWVCVVVAVFGVVELIFGAGFLHALGYYPYQFFAGKINQVSSLLPTPNMFGSAIVLLTALVFRRQGSAKWWQALLLGVLVGSSYSRSAWLAFAVLGASIFFYKVRQRKFEWSVGLMAIGLAFGIFLGIYRFHGTLKSAATHEASTAQHQAAFSKAGRSLGDFGEGWFTGTGIGSAGPATFNSKQPVIVEESWYLQIFQEIGVVGLGLVVAILVALFRQLWHQREPVMAFLILALSANALFLHIWADNRFVHILFWTIMGLLIFCRPKRPVEV